MRWFKKCKEYAEGIYNKDYIKTAYRSGECKITRYLATYDKQGNISIGLERTGFDQEIEWFSFSNRENGFEEFVFTINELYSKLQIEGVELKERGTFYFGYPPTCIKDGVSEDTIRELSILKSDITDMYREHYDEILNRPNGAMAKRYTYLKETYESRESKILKEGYAKK